MATLLIGGPFTPTVRFKDLRNPWLVLSFWCQYAGRFFIKGIQIWFVYCHIAADIIALPATRETGNLLFSLQSVVATGRKFAAGNLDRPLEHHLRSKIRQFWLYLNNGREHDEEHLDRHQPDSPLPDLYFFFFFICCAYVLDIDDPGSLFIPLTELLPST